MPTPADAISSTSPRIFISYRRDDTAGHAGHLYADLVAQFGADRVFMDTETIEPGADFTERLRREIESSDVLIALIGKRWSRRRLRDPGDFVQLEIQEALDRKLRVIPVLVQGARMPSVAQLPESISELSHRNALEISNTRWRHDIEILVGTLHGRKPADLESPPGREAVSGHRADLVSIERKLVTVLFADVIDSTELASSPDPEVVRAVMSRYFEVARAAAATHGGQVEKFVGNAIMAVFGVPKVHDDDAERAVRAGLSIRDAAASEAGLIARVGIDTGDAITTTGSDRELMVSGDTVNVAARLLQGADPGEVVVGALTEELTRVAIEYVPRPPVTAKGKPDSIAAFAAVRPLSPLPVGARGFAGVKAPMIGRKRELSLLLDAFGRVTEDRRAYFVTILGTAGVGKSRLVSEALEQMSDAHVLRGRCLPYGNGITWWCFAEMLRTAAGINFSDDRDTALRKLDQHLALMATEEVRRAMRSRLVVLMGLAAPETVLSEVAPERLTAEIAWGMRHYLDAAALTTPVVAVIDDLQWAEAPVVDTVQHVTERLIDVPVLLICVARPEFLERNPNWSAGKTNSATISIEPLNRAQTETLISELLPVERFPSDLRAQMIARSEGTPLYCEELVRMLIEGGYVVAEGPSWRTVGHIEEIEVPTSVKAVLAARLDGLDSDEKKVVFAASVVGERFSSPDIEAVLERPVTRTLESLIAKGLLLLDRDRSDDNGLRFRHLLIRDAAYDAMTKSDRAAFHERFGLHIEKTAGDPEQFVDILFHHAERALSLGREVQLEGEPMERRARRAFDLALKIGYAAYQRRERTKLEFAGSVAKAAASVLHDSRTSETEAEMALLTALAESLVDLRGATKTLAEAAKAAESCGRTDLVAKALLRLALIEADTYEDNVDEGIIRRAIAACARANDHRSELEARSLSTYLQFEAGRVTEFITEALDLKNETLSEGDFGRAAEMLCWMIIASVVLGRPMDAETFASEAAVICHEHGLVMPMAHVELSAGWLAAYRGEPQKLAEAASKLLVVAEDFASLGDVVMASRYLGVAQRMCGANDDARRTLEKALEISMKIGERGNRTEIYAGLAALALTIKDLEAADRWARLAVQSIRETDVTAASYAERVMGEVHAACGRLAEAEAALRLAVSRSAASEYRTIWAESAAGYAAFCADHGRRQDGLAMVNEIEGWVRSCGYKWLDPALEAIRSSA